MKVAFALCLLSALVAFTSAGYLTYSRPGFLSSGYSGYGLGGGYRSFGLGHGGYGGYGGYRTVYSGGYGGYGGYGGGFARRPRYPGGFPGLFRDVSLGVGLGLLHSG